MKKEKTNSKKQEEVIYVKLNYSEDYEGKKNLLSSEISFLRIARAIKNYKLLRQEELNIKIKITKKINEANIYIRKLRLILPKVKIPEILQKSELENNNIEKRIKISRDKYDVNSIESQLQEIQDRLRQMSR